jgi:hypothetical protein
VDAHVHELDGNLDRTVHNLMAIGFPERLVALDGDSLRDCMAEKGVHFFGLC